MWFLDGRAATEGIAAGQRPEPMQLAEWLRLNDPQDGAGFAADRLQEPLEVAAEDAASLQLESQALTGATLTGVGPQGAILDSASLDGSTLAHARPDYANLNEANIAKGEVLLRDQRRVKDFQGRS